MSLIPMKCTGCGAALEVDDSQTKADCPYCRMPFIIKQNESAQPALANTSSPQDFEIVAGVLLKYKGAATDVVIPDGVIEIGDRAFYGLSTITSITIPNGVRKIGSKKSGESNLLETNPFGKCTGLKKTNIPDSLEEMNPLLFYECKNLEQVDMSTLMLMSYNDKRIYALFFGRPPCYDKFVQRLKEECKLRGVCWNCKKPLILKSNGRCSSCGTKGNL